jgi:hypothetical protein
MPRREDDAVARRPIPVTGRSLLLAGGFALAVLATLGVFLTDNKQYLQLAVVAVAWAFVLAMFAAGRRGTDRVAAAAREAELRHAYEVELDREVAARREYELKLENELRRGTEDAMRYELDALRGDIAALASLRDEVAHVAAMRDDVAALTALRHDIGQLAGLRGEMGRLRAELTEQLSSEMLVERIVMRTQASRLPGEAGRLDSGRWADDVPPRELTGGWPAVRLDEPRETQQFEQVRPERPGLHPATSEPARSWDPSSWENRAHENRAHEGRSYESSAWENLTREASVAGPGAWDAPGTSSYVRPAAPPPVFAPPPASAGPPAITSPAAGDDWGTARPAQDAPARDPYSVGPHSRHSADELAAPPLTTASPIAPSSIARPPVAEPQPSPQPPPATTAFPMAPSSIVRPPVAEPPPSPLDWLAARSLLDEPLPRTTRPEVPPRRRSTDADADHAAVAGSSPEARTEQRPAVPAGPPPVRIDDRGGYRVTVHPPQPPAHPGPSTEGNRLAEILAENGVTPTTGGRRRRRYRDDDEADDVLARVLGRN